MKKAGYAIYALIYNFASLFGQASNRVFFVATHNSSETGNCGAVINELEKSGGYKIFKMTKEDENFKNPLKLLKFMFVLPFKMAGCSTIFYDKTFLPLAYFKSRKKVKHCMLWHGTGAIKKFGLDSTKGSLRKLETLANSKLDYLFVSSKGLIPLHKTAFGIEENKIFVTGLPRTDCLFSFKEAFKENEKIKPRTEECIKVLYAPTFRESKEGNEKLLEKAVELYEKIAEGMSENISERAFENITEGKSENIVEGVSEDIVEGTSDKTAVKKTVKKVKFMVRLHPAINAKYADFFNNMSPDKSVSDLVFEDASAKDLNEVLKETDILITDYSSIFFDFAILNRTMFFYPFDLDFFTEKERGFYFDYKNFVPGEVLIDPDSIADYIISHSENQNAKISDFMSFAYKYQDSASAKRVVNLVFGE
ncbi:MAG: CDP-glycerol glycerophosphotransferase family protein [Lachnospiraceae bacterium]|nr:CDP-glycerol glycerophosphotransferase family protein [Lachnospiraceae bacterium]